MILTKLQLLSILPTFDIEAFNGSSVDVTLADELLIEDCMCRRVITLKKDKMHFTTWDLSTGCFVMPPGRFILGSLQEHLDIPTNCSAIFFLDSGLARCGLEHSAATFLHAGWAGKLTLELKNVSEYHYLKIERDLPIGKIVFFEHEHTEPYKGKYVNQKGTTA